MTAHDKSDTPTPPRVVMSIHFAVSAKEFVLPVVQCLNDAGVRCELWLQDQPKYRRFVEQFQGPTRAVASDVSLNPLTFLRRLVMFFQELRRVKPQVVHAHQTRASLIPLLAARLSGVPVRVYHNHGLPYLGYAGVKRWALRLLERLNVGLATHVLMVSHSNRDFASRDGLIRPPKATVLHNGSATGIDLNQFSWHADSTAREKARARMGVANSQFVLGYVGRPVRRKGFHLLLEAWKETGLGAAGGRLLIAGCSQKECDAASDGPLSGVVARGYITEMHAFYAACDVVTLPSEHEGFGYSLLEAAAAGRATLGTDIPGIRCAIVHGETGLIVPTKDVEALTSTILRLAKDEPFRLRLGRAGRERVEQAFKRDDVLRSFLDYYQTSLIPSEVDHQTDRDTLHPRRAA